VVSADTHASPDSLDHFLSYVDPAQREAVAAFGDMSALAISMFGGFDPGEVDESDPVRATAARRLAGMGVDVDAAQGWLAHYGADWVVPGDGDGRRLAVLEEQGIHAEVTLPGPILAGGLSPAMYLGGHSHKGLEVVWPALHAYVRWLADFCNAAPGRRAGCMPIDFHDMDRAVEEVSWARQHGITGGVMLPAMSVGSRLPGYADEYYEPFWSACEANEMVVTLHTGASGSATDTKFLYDKVHGGMLGLYEVFVFTRRPLWFMILGGVFDRHPDLRVVVTEKRRAVVAFAHPRYGVVLRHPRRRTRPQLPQDAPARLLRAARLARRLSHEALRSRDATRDRHRQAHVGRRLPAP
jgi:hypothetical protein